MLNIAQREAGWRRIVNLEFVGVDEFVVLTMKSLCCCQIFYSRLKISGLLVALVAIMCHEACRLGFSFQGFNRKEIKLIAML